MAQSTGLGQLIPFTRVKKCSCCVKNLPINQKYLFKAAPLPRSSSLRVFSCVRFSKCSAHLQIESLWTGVKRLPSHHHHHLASLEIWSSNQHQQTHSHPPPAPPSCGPAPGLAACCGEQTSWCLRGRGWVLLTRWVMMKAELAACWVVVV